MPAKTAAVRKPEPVEQRPEWAVVVIGIAFLVSGAAGLIHEVVWARLLGHVFGVTSLAVSTVLAAYMGGLALGSWWIGRRSEHIADGRRVYALLEIAIGLFALVVPLLLDVFEPLYGAVWRRFDFSFAVLTVLRLVLAGGLLLGPTIMMGATLPVLAEYMASLQGRRLAPQWLYTVNLGGAVLGVALGGFLLMPTLGLWGTILAGAALNFTAGLAVLGLPALERVPAEKRDEPAPPVRRTSRLLLTAAFVSGVISLASQVAWTRVLLLVVGSTTYAFTTVLLVYLVALAVGSIWASRRGTRVADVAPHLAVAHLVMALGMVIAVYTVDYLPFWYLSAVHAWQPASILGRVALTTAIVFAVLFLPVLFAGMIFPLAMIGAVPRDERHAGSAVGRVYAINTVGAILGAIGGGFVLVPLLGSQRTLLGMALVGAALGVVFALRSERRWLARGAPALALVTAAAAWAVPAWQQKALQSTVFERAMFQDAAELADPEQQQKIVFYREGQTATVAVIEYLGGKRGMRINGRANASDSDSDMPTQVLCAQLPMLLGRPDDVFIVGWASGITVGAALQSPAKRVTAVELEQAAIDGSAFFNHVNHEPLRDPRLRLYKDDARHILLASEDTYDVIISEPSHPWVAGIANLFTKDFFELAARRLKDDGVFSQWLQGYQISLPIYRTILATFQSVFPEVMVYSPSSANDWLLIGSRRPLRFDLAELDRRFADPVVRAELARIGIHSPEHLLAGAYVGPDGVRRLVGKAPINTDDNMYVEFGAPRETVDYSFESMQMITSFLTRFMTPLEDMVTDRDLLLKSPERLRNVIAGLNRQDRGPDDYEAMLAELEK